ncbi:hypothetical protein [Methanolapillus millepedarum]|uniref:hypothetical protein n=1 Tax=Methanolapillus millepedarum TaxID=3028296 RepID=UPI0030B87821
MTQIEKINNVSTFLTLTNTRGDTITDHFYSNFSENIQLFSGFLYHGTTKENAQKILENNFQISSNPKLHLGNGVYFYDDETYAVWWVLRNPVCKVPKGRLKRYISGQDLTICQDVYDCFLRELSVVAVEIENAKYLNLDDPINKKVFNKFYRRLNEKRNLVMLLDNYSIYDVFFDQESFKNKIDMVGMTTNYYNFSKNRSQSTPMLPHESYLYKIYCVKNTEILKKRKRLYITPEIIGYCLEFMVRKEQLFKRMKGLP